jgi:outer membrane receptor protein involved in Fe transport
VDALTHQGVDVRTVPFSFPILTALLLLHPSLLRAQEPGATGVLQGRVVSRTDDGPVPGARLSISPVRSPGNVRRGDPAVSVQSTDGDGRFSLSLPPGMFDLTVEAFGFISYTEQGIGVSSGETTELMIRLEADPFRLDEIVVMPSTFGLLKEHMASGQIISREELQVRPRLGNDIFRTVAQVPGVTTYDHTAAPYVRGSRAEEVLTILDGLELHEPYHLKQWDGSLSIVDVENIQDLDFTTGGFTAEHGDASAGVLSMRSATPTVDGTQTTLGVDFMSSILKNEGTFQDGRGSWLLSARRGFLDLIFEITGIGEDEDLHPSYYDVFAKGEYEIRSGHRLSAHVLHAGDDNHGTENDSTVFRHRYGSSYAWLNWSGELSRTTSVETVFSVGRVWRDRDGADFYQPGSPPRIEVRDQATYDFLGLRQDWKLNIARDLMLKAGAEARWGNADYEYRRWEEVWIPNDSDPTRPDWTQSFDNLRVDTRPTGRDLGVYLASRAQPLEELTMEAGLRYDHQSYTDENQMAPRFNAAYRLDQRTNLRGAWGHYYQSHGLNQLWIADGDETFYPAQRAEHRVLGIEHDLESGITLRVEAYQRLLTDPLPEFRNLEDHTEALKEEGPEDRVFVQAEKGRAQGVELFAKSAPGARIGWSAGYALSKAEEVINGEWIPRPFDQRHAVNLSFAFRPTPRWTLSLGWIYHSPWPSTGQTFDLHRTVSGYGYVTGQFGQMNQERLIPYHRLDFRVSGDIPVTKGSLMVYLDVFNATNRSNAHSANYGVLITESGLVTERVFHNQLEMMPSVGLRWVF